MATVVERGDFDPPPNEAALRAMAPAAFRLDSLRAAHARLLGDARAAAAHLAQAASFLAAAGVEPLAASEAVERAAGIVAELAGLVPVDADVRWTFEEAERDLTLVEGLSGVWVAMADGPLLADRLRAVDTLLALDGALRDARREADRLTQKIERLQEHAQAAREELSSATDVAAHERYRHHEEKIGRAFSRLADAHADAERAVRSFLDSAPAARGEAAQALEDALRERREIPYCVRNPDAARRRQQARDREARRRRLRLFAVAAAAALLMLPIGAAVWKRINPLAVAKRDVLAHPYVLRLLNPEQQATLARANSLEELRSRFQHAFDHPDPHWRYWRDFPERSGEWVLYTHLGKGRVRVELTERAKRELPTLFGQDVTVKLVERRHGRSSILGGLPVQGSDLVLCGVQHMVSVVLGVIVPLPAVLGRAPERDFVYLNEGDSDRRDRACSAAAEHREGEQEQGGTVFINTDVPPLPLFREEPTLGLPAWSGAQ